MDQNEKKDRPEAASVPQAAPGQTIVIERRERVGIVRRLIWPVFFLVVFMCLFSGFLTREVGVPTRLSERYVAGESSLSSPKVAIVEIAGTIDEAEVEHALKQIHQARDDDQVKAVVLRIDSPGGTVSGSDRIWREVSTLKTHNKPLIVSMGGVAASGGYYVAAPADRILAEPTTWTGSIGAKIEFYQLHELMKWAKVDVKTIASGEWKDSGSMYRDMTPEEEKRWAHVVNEAHERFVRVVAQGRKMPLKEANDLANGKVYTAPEAIRIKLVDEIGYLDDAILNAERLARVESARVIRYAKPLNLTDVLFSLSAPKTGMTIDPATVARFQAPQLLFLAR
jgi:protease-4